MRVMRNWTLSLRLAERKRQLTVYSSRQFRGGLQLGFQSHWKMSQGTEMSLRVPCINSLHFVFCEWGPSRLTSGLGQVVCDLQAI
jgi:hypothetical protein